MSIVKIPKKLRNIFDTLRAGEIEEGIRQLAQIKGFEPQKAIALAEINYFKGDYAAAMAQTEEALPFDEQWYAGNVLSEHFFAYTHAAIVSQRVAQAEKFYATFLSQKEQASLPEHRLNTYRHQVSNHLEKLMGKQGLAIDQKALEVITDGKSEADFTEQLKEYRPKLSYNSAKGAAYLLNFMFEKGNTAEALDYYEKYAEEISNEEQHINAARLFLKADQVEKARKAILRYAKGWYPVEYIQVTPMRLWEFDDLHSLLTKELKEEILSTPKAM